MKEDKLKKEGEGAWLPPPFRIYYTHLRKQGKTKNACKSIFNIPF